MRSTMLILVNDRKSLYHCKEYADLMQHPASITRCPPSSFLSLDPRHGYARRQSDIRDTLVACSEADICTGSSLGISESPPHGLSPEQ